MAELNFALKAKNSNSELLLVFDKQSDGVITPTIIGTHGGAEHDVDAYYSDEIECVCGTKFEYDNGNPENAEAV